MSQSPDKNFIFPKVSMEGICKICGEELRLGHKIIGVCSFCVSSKKRKKFIQVSYGKPK